MNKFKLRNGWLKDQMQKAVDEAKSWPKWIKELDEIDVKIEEGYKKNGKTF
jgi:hypothetical protein